MERKKQELEEIEHRIEENNARICQSNEMRYIVEWALQNDTQHISVLSGKETWSVLGIGKTKTIAE